MNKYAALGILIDATVGRRVIVVSRDHHDTRESVAVFAEVCAQDFTSAKIHRASGLERVMVGAGRIDFTTVRGGALRGASVDAVFIDGEAHRSLAPDGLMTPRLHEFNDDLHAIESRGGKVVYA